MTGISHLHLELRSLLDRSTAKIPFATKGFKELRSRIADEVIPGFNTVDEKLIAVYLNLDTRPVCGHCGEPTAASVKKRKFLSFCSRNCTLASSVTREKSKNTLLEKHGVAHNMQVAEVKSAARQTMLQKYGVDNAAKSAVLLAKMQKTRNASYALDPLHTREAKQRAAEHRNQQFRIEGFSDKLSLINQQTKCVLDGDQSWQGMQHYYRWKHTECGFVFEERLIKGQLPLCPRCAPKSKPQEALSKFLSVLGVRVVENDRRMIAPLELDFFLPDFNIGIEVNGCYWHSDGVARYSLLDKTRLAESKGIQLLHFWDYEINEKFEIVSEIIKSKLGKSDRVFARRCKVVQLTSTESRNFLDRHHIAGGGGGFCHLGLLLGEKVVAAAVFGKKRFGGKACNELIRYASHGTVVGGLSKLIRHFRKMDSSVLVSFADRRFSTGRSYKRLGFQVIRETAPNYVWVKGKQRLSRYQTMKHLLPKILPQTYNPAHSEKHNMTSAGWYKITDCGNLLLELC